MGATTFSDIAYSKISARDAFYRAIHEAKYEHGHGGYTGTIAEKDSFVLIQECPTTKEAIEIANRLMDDDDQRISDKWGPAGCISIPSERLFLFFGWASCWNPRTRQMKNTAHRKFRPASENDVSTKVRQMEVLHAIKMDWLDMKIKLSVMSDSRAETTSRLLKGNNLTNLSSRVD